MTKGMVSIDGTWESDEPGRPHIVLGADQTAKGSDGCNGIRTTYTIDGDSVLFEDVVSTLMACRGVDTWLSRLKSGRVDGDTMSILNAEGEQIGTLHRAL